MFYGLVVLCTIGASEYNKDTCKLYNSPIVYATNEECVNGVKTFLSSPGVILLYSAGKEIINVECHNLIPDSLGGIKS